VRGFFKELPTEFSAALFAITRRFTIRALFGRGVRSESIRIYEIDVI
jgi:hypothetical protein